MKQPNEDGVAKRGEYIKASYKKEIEDQVKSLQNSRSSLVQFRTSQTDVVASQTALQFKSLNRDSIISNHTGWPNGLRCC